MKGLLRKREKNLWREYTLCALCHRFDGCAGLENARQSQPKPSVIVVSRRTHTLAVRRANIECLPLCVEQRPSWLPGTSALHQGHSQRT